MNNTKHTPGPWEVTLSMTSVKHVGTQTPDGPRIIAICRQTIDSAPDIPIIANAKLIAAAPELLEACTALRDTLTSHIAMGPPHTAIGMASLDKADRLCRAAITKALGEGQETQPMHTAWELQEREENEDMIECQECGQRFPACEACGGLCQRCLAYEQMGPVEVDEQ